MKLEIDRQGIGDRKEHWWYLVFDEEACNFSIEHVWHIFRFRQRDQEGTESMALAEAKQNDKARYEKAVQIIKEKLFNS